MAFPRTNSAHPREQVASSVHAIFGCRLEVTHGDGSAGAVTNGMKKRRHHRYADGLAPAIKLSTEDSAGINTGSRVKSGAEASA
jgi:hypothetical protein